MWKVAETVKKSERYIQAVIHAAITIAFYFISVMGESKTFFFFLLCVEFAQNISMIPKNIKPFIISQTKKEPQILTHPYDGQHSVVHLPSLSLSHSTH